MLIWSSGLASGLQFSVSLFIAMARAWEELGGLPEPAYRHKDRKGDSYTFMLQPLYTLIKEPISTVNPRAGGTEKCKIQTVCGF